MLLSTQKTLVKLRCETIDQHHQSAMRTSWLELADQMKVSRCILYSSRLVLRNLILNATRNALSLKFKWDLKWAFVLNWIRMTSLESMKLSQLHHFFRPLKIILSIFGRSGNRKDFIIAAQYHCITLAHLRPVWTRIYLGRVSKVWWQAKRGSSTGIRADWTTNQLVQQIH